MKFKVAYERQILTDSSLVGKTQSNSARKITMKFVRGPSATSGLRTPDVVRMNNVIKANADADDTGMQGSISIHVRRSLDTEWVKPNVFTHVPIGYKCARVDYLCKTHV